MGALGNELLVFRGVFMEVWRGCSGCVWNGGDRRGGGFEDDGSGGAFDAVVGAAGWDSGGVDPTFGSGGVELLTEWCDVFDGGAKGLQK